MTDDDDYRRGGRYGLDYRSTSEDRRSGRYENEPYERGDSYNEAYERGGYAGEPFEGGRTYSEYGEPHNRGQGGPYNLSYRSREFNPSAPYDSLNYTRYEPSSSYGESRWGYGTEGRYNESYDRGRYGRGGQSERGFLERAGDEVRSWFGDEEAEQRRRQDELRMGQHRGRGPSSYRRSDERIREDVNDRLTDDAYLDASNIEVSVDSGIVTLKGTVDNRSDKRRAEYLAESVSGVSDVSNQLRTNQTHQIQTTAGQGTAGMETTSTARARSART